MQRILAKPPITRDSRSELRISLTKRFGGISASLSPRSSGGDISGSLANVSRSGFFLIAEPSVKPLDVVTFSIHHDRGDFAPVTGTGVVSWIRTSADSQMGPAGVAIKIADVDGSSRLELFSFLDFCLRKSAVADLMHPGVLTVPRDTRLTDCLQRMCDDNVGAILVTDKNKSLLGIFTERDWLFMHGNLAALDEPVGDFMTKDVVTIAPLTSVLEAWSLFGRRRFRHLPVCVGKEPQGMVSVRDLWVYWDEFLRIQNEQLKIRR